MVSYARRLKDAMTKAGFVVESMRTTTGGCRHEARPVIIASGQYGRVSWAFDVIQEPDQWCGAPTSGADAKGLQWWTDKPMHPERARLAIDRGRGWRERLIEAMLSAFHGPSEQSRQAPGPKLVEAPPPRSRGLRTNQQLIEAIRSAVATDPRCERTSERRNNQMTTTFSRGGARVEVPWKGKVIATYESDTKYGLQAILVGSTPEMVKSALHAIATGRTVTYGKGVNLNAYVDKMHGQTVDHDWRFLVPKIEGPSAGELDEQWDLNPDYQRDAVWTAKQQSRFIGHVLSGGDVPLIICQRYDGPEHCESGEWVDAPIEVIDGQQRLRAICAFVRGDIPAELLHDGEWLQLWWRDFDERDRANRVCSSRVLYVDISRERRLRFYLRLNSGGTAHTEAELEKVRAMLKEASGE